MTNLDQIIKVQEVINEEVAVSTDDGDKLFQYIHGLLQENKILKIDFSGINNMTAAFLNAAIGQLYNEFTSEFLNKHIQISNVSADDAVLSRR